MKQILILLALFTTFGAVRAELLSVTLRADGLTCSMCSLSVHKALARLDFVAEVQPNIADTTFTVKFRPGQPVSLDRVAAAVRDAGFSVGQLRLTFQFDHQQVRDDLHLASGGLVLHFVSTGPRILDGPVELRLVDRGFVPDAEQKRWESAIRHACYRSGTVGECCPAGAPGQRVYHVTL